MTESTRQIVRQGLDQAVDKAIPILQARLQALPEEARSRALQSAEGIRTCLNDLAEAPFPNASINESLMRLIFGHADPMIVEALKEFAEVVNFYLMDARDRMHATRERLDS